MISWITTLIGRFHPLLVHLPIGILFLSFAFECLSIVPRYAKLKWAIQPTLFLGALFSLMAALSGYFLSQEGGYDDDLLSKHQTLGIATTLFCVFLFFAREVSYVNRKPRRVKKLLRISMAGVMILLLTLTGHFGGSLTHGEEFLSFTTEPDTPGSLVNLTYNDSAIYYEQVIQPLLKSKCYSCHSAKKQKGELRLDAIEFIQKGGEHGAVISGTIADSSSLYARLMLPPDHKEHMPPNEKPQLSSAEISLIQIWLEEGAKFDKQVIRFSQRDKIKQYIQLSKSSSQVDMLLPEVEVGQADQQTVEALRKQNVIVLPVSAESNYLSLSFINVKDITDEQLQWVVRISDQVVHLMLPNTTINDQHLSIIRNLRNLRILDLRHTLITDKSAEDIIQLKELRILNVMSTKLTDAGLSRLGELKHLQKLFLYQTNITPEGVARLYSQLPKLEVDTGGYKLPVLVTDTLVVKRKV